MLGNSVTITGPDDEVKATFAKALLKLRISTSPQSRPVAQKTRGQLRDTPHALIAISSSEVAIEVTKANADPKVGCL